MSETNVDAENRRNHWLSKKKLGAIAVNHIEDVGVRDDATFGVYLVPKAKHSRLALPNPLTVPDLDGAKWILEKANTIPEEIEELQSIINKQLKRPESMGNDAKDLVSRSGSQGDEWLYLSALIVQDKSEKAKRSIQPYSEELALEQLMGDPKLADCMDANGFSCTEIAARRGCFKLLKALLEQDPQRIRRRTFNSKNILHYAASCPRSNVDMIESLCTYKEERLAEQRDFWGATPLQVALMFGVLENVKCLLPHTKQFLEAPSSGKGEPATCTAISQGRGFSGGRLCDVLEILLESVSVNSQDYRGLTALRSAAEADDEFVWQLLLREHRADPNLRDFHGTTAVAHACEWRPASYLGKLEKYCIDSRTDIDWWSIDDDGDSPFSVAKKNDDPEVAIFVATRISESKALEALNAFKHNHIICADIHSSLKNYDTAIKLLEQAGPHETWNKEAQRLHKIARLKLELDAPNAAEALLKQALAIYDKEIKPHSPEYYVSDNIAIACMHTTLARAFIMKENHADAMKSIDIALDVEFRDYEKSVLINLRRRAE